MTIHKTRIIPSVKKQLYIKLWTALATEFKDKPETLIYEWQNEKSLFENKIDMQKDVIEAIREVDNVHPIIIDFADKPGYTFDEDYYTKQNLTTKNLILSAHLYNPFLFTHQGQWWDTSVITNTARDIPWPYNPETLPDEYKPLSAPGDKDFIAADRASRIRCHEFMANEMAKRKISWTL
jgi:endoglucanase